MSFDPFNRLLDLIEFEGLSDDDALTGLSEPNAFFHRLVHEGLVTWVDQAVRRYRDVFLADMVAIGARDVVAVRPWVHQVPPSDASSRTHELCVWGRAYTYRSSSRLVRELRVPVTGSTEDRLRSDAEKSTMAYVVAMGSLIDNASFDRQRGRYLGGMPFPVLPPDPHIAGTTPPDLVRVLEVSCTDGAVAPLFQGSVETAEAYFAEHGRTAIRDLFRSTARRPGYDCLECKERKVCDRLPRYGGMLGISDVSRPRRVYTATTGRYHDECAAQEHFRTLRLPVDDVRETPSAVRQGNAVHAWLQRLHDRVPRRPCTTDDLPEDPRHWTGGSWRLEGAEAENAAAMLASHLEVCPYLGLAPEAPAHTERVIAADDPHCDTLVIAHADLVYRRSGSWNYREVKTTSLKRITDGDLLLSRYQQTALAILLYEAGAIPLGPLSAVELEILTPHGPDLRILDPRSPALREEARRTVRPWAAAWHADAAHLANPGPACRRCPYHQWCPSAEAGEEVKK
ncbi:PD-(D/E)XK nuclease family protein [Actinomadura rubrisoli]|nr:PD-(D/E)XK nuclease family protein [Actinomadura rubrisoli]